MKLRNRLLDREFYIPTSGERRGNKVNDLVDQYSIYLLDKGIFDPVNCNLTEQYRREMNDMDDDDLDFLTNEGIFAYTMLDKYRRDV